MFVNGRVRGNDTAIRRNSVRKRRTMLILLKGETDVDQGRDSASLEHQEKHRKQNHQRKEKKKIGDSPLP